MNAGIPDSAWSPMVTDSDLAVGFADPQQPDSPLTFVNNAFCRLTGYEREACLGHNCRFLQGAGTSAEAVRRVRQGIAEQRFRLTELVNYRRDGEPFVNALLIGPVLDGKGGLLRLFGMQWDLSKTRERRRGAQADGWTGSEVRMDLFEALVDRIANLSGRLGHEASGIAVVERLIAVSRPQQYPPDERLPNWTRAAALLEYLIDPYRFQLPITPRLSGDAGIVAADVATPLALCVHELASHTLRLAAGGIEVRSIELHCETTSENGESVVRLNWLTRCPDAVTPVEPPDRFAFVDTVSAQMFSRFEYRFDAGRLQASVSVPNRPWEGLG